MNTTSRANSWRKGSWRRRSRMRRAAAEKEPLDIRYISYAELLKQIRSARQLSDAEALQRSGANAQALELLREALKSDPNNPELEAAQQRSGQSTLPALTALRIQAEQVRPADAKVAPRQAEQKRTFHLRGPVAASVAGVLQPVWDHRDRRSIAGRQADTLRHGGRGLSRRHRMRCCDVAHTFLVPASETEGVCVRGHVAEPAGV